MQASCYACLFNKMFCLTASRWHSIPIIVMCTQTQSSYSILNKNAHEQSPPPPPSNARASHGIAHQIACTNNAAQRAPFSSAPASFRRVGGQIGGALSFFLVRAFICAIARGYRDTHTRMAPPPTLAGLIYVTAFLRQPDWLAGQFGSA